MEGSADHTKAIKLNVSEIEGLAHCGQTTEAPDTESESGTHLHAFAAVQAQLKV